MSLPEFPTISPALTREDAVNQIISSIAMEELALSHIINAEGEKLQYVLGTIPGLTGPQPTIDQVLEVNKSIQAVLQSAAENQTILKSKLQNVLSSAVLTGPTGAIGPTGPTGPSDAIIPFCISYGNELAADQQGKPSIITLTGFGPVLTPSLLLLEGEWDTGTITIREGSFLGSSFIIPRDAILRKIYIMFSLAVSQSFEEGSIIRPFVCLATTNSDSLAFEVLEDTITLTEIYEGGVALPQHTLKKGSSTNLNASLAEGELIVIIAGIMAENNTTEVRATFAISGGLYLE